MTAIKTVFAGPTATRTSRILARRDGKIVHTAAFNHAFDMGQNHIHAAQEVAHQLGLTGGKLYSSYLEPGVHVHVWVEDAKPAPVAPLETAPKAVPSKAVEVVDLGLFLGQSLEVHAFRNGWFVRLGDENIPLSRVTPDTEKRVRGAVADVCTRRGWADISQL